MPTIKFVKNDGMFIHIDNDYVNRMAEPMFNDMRYLLIQLLSDPIIHSYPIIKKVAMSGLISDGAISMDDNTLISGFNNLYSKNLNECWHMYGKNKSPHIKTSINKILSHNLIKGVSCLFRFFRTMGTLVIDNIDLLCVKKYAGDLSLKKFKSSIRKIVTDLIDIIFKIQMRSNTVIKCQPIGSCMDYDGRDMFMDRNGERIL